MWLEGAAFLAAPGRGLVPFCIGVALSSCRVGCPSRPPVELRFRFFTGGMPVVSGVGATTFSGIIVGRMGPSVPALPSSGMRSSFRALFFLESFFAWDRALDDPSLRRVTDWDILDTGLMCSTVCSPAFSDAAPFVRRPRALPREGPRVSLTFRLTRGDRSGNHLNGNLLFSNSLAFLR